MTKVNTIWRLSFLAVGFILGVVTALLLTQRYEMQAIRTEHGIVFYKIDRLSGRTEWTASEKAIDYNETPQPWREFPK